MKTLLLLLIAASPALDAQETVDTLKTAFRQRANEDVLTRLINYRKSIPDNSNFEVDYMIASELTDLRFSAACEFAGSLTTAYAAPRLFNNQEAPLEALRRRSCAGVMTTFKKTFPPPPPPTPGQLLGGAQDELSKRCRQGFVWREAFPGDRVCVTPETRAQAVQDNQSAAQRRLNTGFCRQGWVWREANKDDHVCVTPAVRQQTWDDNAAASRRMIGAVSAGRGAMSPRSTAAVRLPAQPAPPPAPPPARPQQIIVSRVAPGLRDVTISFSTTQATDPWVEICQRRPEPNLTFNSKVILVGRSPHGVNHRVRVELKPGEYYYVISARDAAGKVIKVTGQFGTAHTL